MDFQLTDLNQIDGFVPCPNTDKALAYLMLCSDANDQLETASRNILDLKTRRAEITGEPSPDQAAELSAITEKKEVVWDKLLCTSVRRYGEHATYNALFLIDTQRF